MEYPTFTPEENDQKNNQSIKENLLVMEESIKKLEENVMGHTGEFTTYERKVA